MDPKIIFGSYLGYKPYLGYSSLSADKLLTAAEQIYLLTAAELL
jgi:hypothetical protein